MDVKIEINTIQLGMYVTELDRPWSDSTFLFQGFLIENDEQIQELQDQCSYVIVSQERSSPGIFAPEPKKEPVKAPQSRKDADTLTIHAVDTEQNSKSKSGIFGFFKELFTARSSADNTASASDKASQEAMDRIEEIRQKEELAGLRSNFSKQAGVTAKISDYATSASVKEETAPAKTATEKFEQEIASNLMLEMTGADLGDRIEVAKELLVDVVDSIIRNPNAMMLISKLKNIDANSYQHAMDVCIMMISFGRQLGLPKSELNKVGLGALLHDIGKSQVNKEILEKRTKLSPEEYEEVKKHVSYGVDVLLKAEKLGQIEQMIIERHHERYDGKGYPKGLAGEEIGLYGCMAAIVETYSTITSEKPYAPARSSAKAVTTLMALRGKAFHPELVDQFVQVVGVYPIGSVVELTTGEVGIVLEQNKLWRLKPLVSVLVGADGKKLSRPYLVDLAKPQKADTDKPLAIANELPAGTFGIQLKDYFL